MQHKINVKVDGNEVEITYDSPINQQFKDKLIKMIQDTMTLAISEGSTIMGSHVVRALIDAYLLGAKACAAEVQNMMKKAQTTPHVPSKDAMPEDIVYEIVVAKGNDSKQS